MQTGIEWRLARLLRLHKWVASPSGPSLPRPAGLTGVPCSLPCSTRSSLISFLTFYDFLWHLMTLHYPNPLRATTIPTKMLRWKCLDQILITSYFILSHLRKHVGSGEVRAYHSVGSRSRHSIVLWLALGLHCLTRLGIATEISFRIYLRKCWKQNLCQICWKWVGIFLRPLRCSHKKATGRNRSPCPLPLCPFAPCPVPLASLFRR